MRTQRTYHHTEDFLFRRRLREVKRMQTIVATGGRVLDEVAKYRRHKKQKDTRTRSERRADNRQKILPKDRRCPVCKKIKVNSRRWVAVDGKCVCLSCYRLNGAKLDVEDVR